jgi:hypothetical protein
MRSNAGRPRAGTTLAAVLAAGTLILAGCNGGGGATSETAYPDDDNLRRGGETTYSEPGSLFGEGGLTFGGGDGPDAPQGGAGIGVNSFLWRASLDTVSFMPLSSADPFGGVIITDWYSPPESPNERFKLNLYILGRELRADGLRASVFRQVRRAGTWQDAPVEEATATKLENAILSRAREMRIARRDE